MTPFKLKSGAALAIIAMLSACGGGDNNSQTVVTAPPTAGTPTPSPTPTATCSLSSRQQFAKAVIDEWYLFPELIVANVDPSQFSTVQDYIDALTATARAQDKDRNFTYITSIAEENAFLQSGASAGFGIRLSFAGGNQLFIIDSYEGAPALAAGIDRGAEILAVGTNPNDLRTVSDLLSGGDIQPLIDALGPSDAGISRVLQIKDANGTRNVTVTKASFALPPISPRFGVQIIDDRGNKVGYVNLRTFIDTAVPALEKAFAQFRAQNVTSIIIDFRYNGGGLVSVAELMGDLLGRNRNASDVYSYTTLRPSKASENTQYNFKANGKSIAPGKIAVIGTGGTASASELVTNSMAAYLGKDLALVGSNTFGKPVGQHAFDVEDCDDRMRVVTFKTENKDREGEYFSGLASTLDTTCSAPDDFSQAMGSPLEASTRQALDFIAGDTCTPIPASAQSAQSAGRSGLAREKQEILMPRAPSPYQREVPGSF